MTLDFVALDFETANPKRGSVIQIGITKVRDGQVRKTATSFITPPPGLGRHDPRCTAVHGIRKDQLVGAPEWPEILDRIIRFSGGLPLVAHNASVERSCIVQASEAYDVTPPDFSYFCTMKLARHAYPRERSHSLGILTASLGLPAFGHHDAGEDAVASAVLLLRIAEEKSAASLDDLAAGWMAKPKARYRAPQMA